MVFAGERSGVAGLCVKGAGHEKIARNNENAETGGKTGGTEGPGHASDLYSLGPADSRLDPNRLSAPDWQCFRQGLAGGNIRNSGFEQVAMRVGGQYFSIEIVPQKTV